MQGIEHRDVGRASTVPRTTGRNASLETPSIRIDQCRFTLRGLKAIKVHRRSQQLRHRVLPDGHRCRAVDEVVGEVDQELGPWALKQGPHRLDHDVLPTLGIDEEEGEGVVPAPTQNVAAQFDEVALQTCLTDCRRRL
jgi:hypothetical protein